MSYYPPEISEQDIKEHKRLAQLYNSLSEEERRFVVAQWDSQNNFEDWRTRLQNKDKKVARDRRNTIIGLFAILIVFGLLFYFVPKYNEGRYSERKLEYIYKKAEESKSLKQNLREIDREIENIQDLLIEEKIYRHE
ncbi:MAG: hypothetical protein KAS66_03755 [Candidatus Omnitrophica bacterium]|nr:hypothetical protein [Candidatus Omnitrophota bacterium]